MVYIVGLFANYALLLKPLRLKWPRIKEKFDRKILELRIMLPSLDLARAHIRVLELEAERLRTRHERPATFKRVRSFISRRSH